MKKKDENFVPPSFFSLSLCCFKISHLSCCRPLVSNFFQTSSFLVFFFVDRFSLRTWLSQVHQQFTVDLNLCLISIFWWFFHVTIRKHSIVRFNLALDKTALAAKNNKAIMVQPVVWFSLKINILFLNVSVCFLFVSTYVSFFLLLIKLNYHRFLNTFFFFKLSKVM